MPTAPRPAFEVEMTDDQAGELVDWLADAVDRELDARSQIIGDPEGIGGGDLDRAHKLYEGGDRNLTKEVPWPGAANLTSYIGTEKVDALRARIIQTIFTEPIWIVEGWGAAAARAPFVEEFHQWKAEEERLQSFLSKVIHNALIEGTGVLEVSERVVLRKVRTQTHAAVRTDAQGRQLVGAGGQFMPQELEPGVLLPAPPGAPGIEVIEDRYASVRRGPQYRVLSLRDFVLLPGTVPDRRDVWGYAKRCWVRVGNLASLETLGIYKNVEELGEEDERETRTDELRFGQWVAAVPAGPNAQKEIWELLFLRDLDEDGIEEWYVATFHRRKRILLRIQRDDIGQARYILFTPYPRPDSVYGYSLITHKLGTIIDEHTAWRNMLADRSVLAVNSPVKRMQGSSWDPRKVPFGPRAVITVRDMREVEMMQISDPPGAAFNREGTTLQAAERMIGVNDVTQGSFPQADRTLGEVQLVAQQSFIRIEEIIKHFQEGLEDLFQLRHSIWKRTLYDMPEPLSPQLREVLVGLEDRGVTVPDGPMTYLLLEGDFRGKPRGSVESADLQRMRADFNGLLIALTQLSQSIPIFQQVLSNPEAAKAILDQAMRVYRWPDRRRMEAALAGAPQGPEPGLPGQQRPPAGGAAQPPRGGEPEPPPQQPGTPTPPPAAQPLTEPGAPPAPSGGQGRERPRA